MLCESDNITRSYNGIYECPGCDWSIDEDVLEEYDEF